MRDVASRMIERFGSTATYKVRSGSINNTTLKKTATETEYTVKLQVSRFVRGVTAGLVQDGDLEGRLAATDLGFTPNKNDKIVWNGKNYTVVNVDLMKVGGVDCVYILVMRGA